MLYWRGYYHFTRERPLMNDLYMRLTYEQYKALEDQLDRWEEIETIHTTVDGGYHKALRLVITDSLIVEFMGPLVKPPLYDGEHQPSSEAPNG